MRFAIIVLLCLLTATACGTDPTASAEYEDLEERNSELERDLSELAEAIASLEEQLVVEQPAPTEPLPIEALPAAVADFKLAYESGDLETIQDLFTRDGIMTTTDKIHELYWGGTHHLGTWDTEGSEFRRLAGIHRGEMFITDFIEVGDRTVAFDWEWEDFASGTAILHLRDGEIAVAVLSVTEYEIPER